jgi:predicted ATPase
LSYTWLLMKRTERSWSVLQPGPLFAVLLLLSGCTSSGGKSLVLDTRQVPAVENLPREVTVVMNDLGYEVIPETDAKRWARNFDDYKMRFRSRADANIRVDVDFKLVDNLTRMRLYNSDKKTPGDITAQRYDELKQRLQQEFGVDSVD